jgi:hypothetical protein
MNIRIKVKSISKLKDFLTYERYATAALTVRELICEMAAFNVERFNKGRNADELFLLSEEAAEDMAREGKVAFGGRKDNKRKVDVRIMQDEAVFQFKNGRFKIINETKKREYTSLDEELSLNEDDGLVFIKLAMLAGRRF